MTSVDHYELEKKLEDPNAAPMALPLKFMKDITSNFSTESELGRGGFGVVYKGVLQSGKFIAVKKLFEIRLTDQAFQNEVSYLMGIKHENIVRLLGYCAESRWEAIEQPSGSRNHIWPEMPDRLMCFEYVSNKSLDKHIADRSLDLEWNVRYEIIKGICNGLHYLHEECRIIHLDLKPENILMDSNMIPKIADFGLSRIFGEELSHFITNNRVGTRGYMAPEYLIHGVLSKKADIFSLGVIMTEIITGCREYPYFVPGSPQSIATSCQHFVEEVLETWRNKFESTSKHMSMEESNLLQVKHCITIALKCIHPKREERPTANDIIQKLAADQVDDESLGTSDFCWDWDSDYDNIHSRGRYEPAADVARILALRWVPYAVAVSAARALLGPCHQDLRLRLQKPKDYLRRTFLDGADLMSRPFAARDRFVEEDLYVCTDGDGPLAPALQAVNVALAYVAATNASHNACDCYYDAVRNLMELLVDGERVVVNRAAFEAKFSLQWIAE